MKDDSDSKSEFRKALSNLAHASSKEDILAAMESAVLLMKTTEENRANMLAFIHSIRQTRCLKSISKYGTTTKES